MTSPLADFRGGPEGGPPGFNDPAPRCCVCGIDFIDVVECEQQGCDKFVCPASCYHEHMTNDHHAEEDTDGK